MTRVRSILFGAAGLTLVACANDSSGPGLDDGVLAPGQAATLSGTSALKVQGGPTGTENVLVLVDTGFSDIKAKFTYQVTATGTGGAGAVSPPTTALVPLAEKSVAAAPSASAPVLDIGYGMRLNARNRARWAHGFRAARSALQTGTARPSGSSRSVAIVDPQVGDVVTVNVGQGACTPIENRGARVVAIGTQSIVLSDTLNPAGGFTAADYQRFATRFDTLVYPVDVANFGAPADIDKNKKIVLLFTTAVNELTPANSQSYVGGFFFDRDLFPIADTPDLQGCAGSNFGELFYLLAPDPTGVINGNVRRTGFVDSVTTAVLAHEFQHLINASRRLYVTQGVEDFEVTWLNEGLSHIAEELLFFHEANLTPRQNIDTIKIRSTNTIRTAFNADQSSNAARYRSFLVAPSENSPFRDDDSLETRGATWNLLRYLADQKGGSDVATWQALVNTGRVGLSNLSAVFGSDIASKERDWNVSHYTDDIVSGLAAVYTQPSWHWHSIYKAVAGSGKAYPLEAKSFTAGAATGTLIGGAAAYYRFSVPANSTATITLSTPGPLDGRVVRLR
ncbi:MAG: hypothetical protein DMD35_01545 [Gemmatimonadetes bacterium]|nr:MAG: hypothetical protein DMD35_01545 [Gemmatimonadota bacterium]